MAQRGRHAGYYYFAFRLIHEARRRRETSLYKQRMRLRNSTDPCNISDTEFTNRYRLNKEAFKFLCNELRCKSSLKSSQRITLEHKFLLILTSAGSGVFTVLLGTQLQFHWAPAWFTVVLIYGFSFVFTLGCAVIPFVLASEVFLPEVRSFCNSVVMAFTWIFNFITLVIFNPLVEAVGLGPVFYFFSVVCFTGTLYSKICIPETKGLSVDAIQVLFLKGRRQSIKK